MLLFGLNLKCFFKNKIELIFLFLTNKGPLTGLVNRYELHVIFRLLAAMSIAHMVQAATVICKYHF